MIEPGAPFHIHFSDIAYANRNETKHLPYGEGTLRVEPLRDALDALRAAGDGDQRVAGRGVDSDDRDGAARRERRAARLVGDGLVVAAARAQELREVAQRPVLERA